MNALTRFFYNLFSKRTLPYWCICLFDSAIMLLSAYFVFAINNGVTYTTNQFWQLTGTLLFYLLFYIISFYCFRTYSGIIRYSSFIDLQRVSIAVVVAMCASMIVSQIPWTSSFLVPIPLRDILFWSMLTLLMMWWMRVIIKYLYDIISTSRGAEKVFIFGVKRGGISLAKNIRNQDPAHYVLGGFVVSDPSIRAKVLMGVKVWPFDLDLPGVMAQKGAKAIFISPSATEQFRSRPEIVNALVENDIKIFMTPSEIEWDGKSDLTQDHMREVDIEDLLPRQEIEIDMKKIGSDLRGKSILITGAAGSIGSEMVHQIARFGPQSMLLIDQAETPLHDVRLFMAREFPDIKTIFMLADIVDAGRMRELFESFRPDYVFHAAAYKHVPMMEDNPAEAIRNNVNGTRILADLAVKNRVRKFVMISTDKAVNPTNVMGASKRICEIYVQSLDTAIKEGRVRGVTQFVTTRFGNVLGSNGSVIPLFKEQIKRGGPLTVTHPEIIRYFMLIPEACRLVLEACTMGHGGEIFVFDMGQPVKIVDLARRMIKLSGRPDIKIIFTGLRDGEKLYEEVFNANEETLPTFHPKVKIARVRQYDYTLVNAEIGDMIRASMMESDMQIVARMKRLVPEFKSQHSKYEALDLH